MATSTFNYDTDNPYQRWRRGEIPYEDYKNWVDAEKAWDKINDDPNRTVNPTTVIPDWKNPGGSRPPNSLITNEIIGPSYPGTVEGELGWGTVSGRKAPFNWRNGQWVQSTSGVGGGFNPDYPNAGSGGFGDYLTGVTGAGGEGGGTGTDTAAPYGPQTQYLRALGIGGGYQNPAQKYLANMYDQFRNIWALQQPINTATGGTSQDWGQYIGNLGGGMQNVYSQAANTLSKLLGMSNADRATAGFNFEPQYDPVTGEKLTSTETGELSIANLQSLLGQGTAQRFGPIGSNWLSGRIPQLQQDWQLGQAGGGTGTTFLDYLMKKYNL